FFSNPNNDPHLSEQVAREFPHLGTVYTSRGVVSLQNDHGTSYEMFIMVQNELSAAISELRDQMSREHFGVPFSSLRNTDERRHSIQRAIPVAISEAEPRGYGGN
ncbi:MAG: biopolymer transporter ExbD, partial [Bacteroidales bacterium]|nr:biopolymer transporter ExbD [Bacteroidales bacterium]